MKNIDYLELFFRKHNLSGKIHIKFSSSYTIDEYMTEITFDNGDVINIKDVIFDIDSKLPNDIYEKWMEVKRVKDISLAEWIQTDIKYFPSTIDKSSVEDFQNELTSIVEGVKNNINTIFTFTPDDGDSDEDEEGEDE